VVVATGAGNGQRLQPLGDGVDAVVEDLFPVAVETIAQSQETHGGPGIGFGLADLNELVRRQLLQNKLVVGLVVVKRRDHVIPVGPGVRIKTNLASIRVALGVRIARNVQPVTAPTLTKVFRAQQSIDRLLVGSLGGVLFKRRNFFERGRQAGQIE